MKRILYRQYPAGLNLTKKSPSTAGGYSALEDELLAHIPTAYISCLIPAQGCVAVT